METSGTIRIEQKRKVSNSLFENLWKLTTRTDFCLRGKLCRRLCALLKILILTVVWHTVVWRHSGVAARLVRRDYMLVLYLK